MNKILKLCLLACPLIAIPPAQAEVELSGYASVVAGMTMNKGEAFLNDDIGGGVYTDELEFAPESLFALQTKVDLEEGLSATAQIVARGAADYTAKFEWAYLSYKLNSNWTVQAGRKGDVLYKYSDYRDVGYSYDQMRLPVSMYAAPFNSYDGLNFLHKAKVAGMYSLVNVYYGNVQTDDPFNSVSLGVPVDMTIDDFHGVVWDLSKSWWEARLGVHRGSIQINAGGAPATGNLSKFLYITAAFGAELGNFKGVIEASDYSDKDGTGFNPALSYFSNFAYSMGNFTPSISYSNFQESGYTGVTTSGLEGPEVGSTYTALNLKYDFHTQATFKASYAMYTDDSDTAGAAGGDADVLSFGVDFVF